MSQCSWFRMHIAFSFCRAFLSHFTVHTMLSKVERPHFYNFYRPLWWTWADKNRICFVLTWRSITFWPNYLVAPALFSTPLHLAWDERITVNIVRWWWQVIITILWKHKTNNSSSTLITFNIFRLVKRLPLPRGSKTTWLDFIPHGTRLSISKYLTNDLLWIGWW